MRLAPAQPLAEKLERAWDRELFSCTGLATLLGWETHWTFLSKGSRAGYPDRTCCRERILFVELKREASTATPLTDAQRGWLDRLARAGGECYLWRPSDLDEIAEILARRGHFEFYGEDKSPGALVSDHAGYWTPRSLWIPGVGRSDTTEQQNLLTKGAA